MFEVDRLRTAKRTLEAKLAVSTAAAAGTDGVGDKGQDCGTSSEVRHNETNVAVCDGSLQVVTVEPPPLLNLNRVWARSTSSWSTLT